VQLYHDLDLPYRHAVHPALERHEAYLAKRICTTTDGRWWVLQHDGVWLECKSQKSAKLSAAQWLGVEPDLRLTTDDVSDFMKDRAPVIYGGMKVPTSNAPFIAMFDRTWVNTWRPSSLLTPDPAALSEPLLRVKLQTLLRMIREGLCGRPDPRNLDDMLAILESGDPQGEEQAFIFTLHWLAAPLQTIGRNLQTNLWHVGEMSGVGKGTLVLCMERIYGFGNTATLNQDELKQGGWSDSIDGALWVTWNEVSQGDSRRYDTNSWIKNNTTDDLVQIRRRHTDSYPRINFANYYLSGNRESCPWGALDWHDRRNAIFATSQDINTRDLSLAIRSMARSDADGFAKVLQGFLYLLRNIKVNEELLAFAPMTEIKKEMLEANATEIDGVWWLENSNRVPLDKWVANRDLIDDYKTVMDSPNIRPRQFGGMLSKLARHGYIQMRKLYNTSRKEYFVSSERFPRDGRHPEPDRGTVIQLAAPR